jgi:hypothetical protein
MRIVYRPILEEEDAIKTTARRSREVHRA